MSKSSKMVLVVGGDMSYARPYIKLAKKLGLQLTGNHEVLFKSPESVALVIFTGGADVDPSFYGVTAHRTTHSLPHRDAFEKKCFDEAAKYGIPLAGICRGAQFLCTRAGGKLVQDVTSHAGAYHPLLIKQEDGTTKSVLVNSSHHQMQHPFNLVEGVDYELIGWMEEPRSRHYAFDAQTEVPAGEADAKTRLEPDIVYYPKIKALAAQYHPEWLDEMHEGFIAYEELIERYIAPLITNDENRTRAA